MTEKAKSVSAEKAAAARKGQRAPSARGSAEGTASSGRMPREGKWDRSRDLLFWTKLQAVAMCVLLVVLTYFTISTSVKMHKLDRSIELVEQDLEQLQMKDVNEAIDALSAAADNFARIDMDAFNQTVDNLNRVTESLAKVSEALGRIGSIFGGSGGD